MTASIPKKVVVHNIIGILAASTVPMSSTDIHERTLGDHSPAVTAAALLQLREEGIVSVSSTARKRQFSITRFGREEYARISKSLVNERMRKSIAVSNLRFGD